MKRLTLLLVAIMTIGLGRADAMNYEEARQEAWFLTDKMAYELNLTPEQYDHAYRVNLDYLMSINTPADCYGYYWSYRDADFRCILFDWQYSLYSSIDYFFRPVRWLHSSWYFPVFDRYRRGYYYYDRPAPFFAYRGGAWAHRSRRDDSPYRGVGFRPGRGMRDNYPGMNRPDGRPEPARPGNDYNRPGNNYNRPGQPANSQRPGGGRNDNAGVPGSGNNNRPDNGNRRPGADNRGQADNRNDNRNDNRRDDRNTGRPDNSNTSRPGGNNRGNDSGNNRGGGTYTRPGGDSGRSSRNESTTRSNRSSSNSSSSSSSSAPSRGGRSFGGRR